MCSVCTSSELLTLNIDPGSHTIKRGTRSEHDLRDDQILGAGVVTNIAKILKGDDVVFHTYGI